MTTPEEIYQAVAEDRARRWGYNETLDPKTLADYIQRETEDQNLRADVDVVWREAQQGGLT